MFVLGLIAFFSLVGLLVLHEWSHFWLAKRFQLAVQEFGIGFPPRLWAKRVGSTLFSLNLLPFGAFVKIDEQELRQRPIGQRAMIVLAGVVSFWLIAWFLLTTVLILGVVLPVDDRVESQPGDRVQVIEVLPDSPAKAQGILAGDIIRQIKTQKGIFEIKKARQVIDLIKESGGQEIVLSIEREGRMLEKVVTPRVSPLPNQGSLGIAFLRLAMKKYPPWSAIGEGFRMTWNLTWAIILTLGRALTRVLAGLPAGAELVGPVATFGIFVKSASLGPTFFLQTMALIALHLSIFNALPIPVTDGGRLLFLAVEKIKKGPLDEKLEQRINAAFFFLLIALMIFVTIKDITRLLS